jgi:RNA polymerase sigma-70 factor, ECF subfamily
MDLEKEKKLVKKAQKNKKHFEELYTHYYTKIRTYVYNKVSNNGLADDLTSEVFERALESIDSFQWQGVSFGAWLYRIARNRVFDYYRSARRKKHADLREELKEDIPDEDSLEEKILHDDREMMLYTLIASLDNEDQFLLYYRYFEGMSIREISGEVDQTEANVATRLHRIRAKLKKLNDSNNRAKKGKRRKS